MYVTTVHYHVLTLTLEPEQKHSGQLHSWYILPLILTSSSEKKNHKTTYTSSENNLIHVNMLARPAALNNCPLIRQ